MNSVKNFIRILLKVGLLISYKSEIREISKFNVAFSGQKCHLGKFSHEIFYKRSENGLDLELPNVKRKREESTSGKKMLYKCKKMTKRQKTDRRKNTCRLRITTENFQRLTCFLIVSLNKAVIVFSLK